MDIQLSMTERSALLVLMTFVEEASNPDIAARYGFSIDRKDRERLEKLGLLTIRLNTRPRRWYVHELTDLGWRWCREELATATPERAPRAYRLTYGVLNCLDQHMRRSRLEMADVFVPHGDPAERQQPPAVEERIRAAYAALVAEQDGWVNLNRLRIALADLSREAVDEALRRLDLQPRVYLIPEANQKTLSNAERAAGIRIGGEDKHLLSIEST